MKLFEHPDFDQLVCERLTTSGPAARWRAMSPEEPSRER